MQRFRLGALVALTFLASLPSGLARAEDPAPVPAEDPSARLRGALETWGAAPGAALRGVVELQNHENAMGMMDMLKGLTGSVSGRPFQGGFEAWSTTEARAVVTDQDVPGIAFLEEGKRKLARVVYEKDAPDVSAFRREVIRLLDRAKLTKSLAGLSWTVKGTPAETTTFEAKASTSLVPSDGSGAAPKGVTVEADLAADGALKAIRLTVVRADPFDAIRAMAQMMGQGGMTGMLPPPATEDKLPRTIYTLTPAGDQPLERTKKFLDEMQALGAK